VERESGLEPGSTTSAARALLDSRIAKEFDLALNLSPRLWRAAALSLLGFILVAPTTAQTAEVILLGPGCGTPTPALNATLPVYTMPWTIFLSNAVPNAPYALAITMPPDPPLVPLGPPGCFLWVTPNGTPGHPPFLFFGTTSNLGTVSLTFPIGALLPFPPGSVCNAQAVVMDDGPGSEPLPWFQGFASNGIALVMGDPPGMTPGTPDMPNTYLKTEWGGNGAAGQLLIGTFNFAFPLGLEVGDYDTMMGACPPNGKLWTVTGINALRSYLMLGGGTNGSFDMDALNSALDCGGGPLGREVAALAMNIRYHDLGLLGAAPGLFGTLMLIDPASSLHMQTVNQVFAAAQNALAGFALPAGYSYTTLTALVQQLNLSFHNQMTSMWAGMHLFAPTP
jgi:hypothetical protein